MTIKTDETFENEFINTAVLHKFEPFIRASGLEECAIFGGAILNNHAMENKKISDYDICVLSDDVFYDSIKTAKEKGWNLKGTRTFLGKNSAVLTPPHDSSFEIDFSVKDKLDDIGIWTLDSPYVVVKKDKNGELNATVVDKSDALKDLKKGKLRLLDGREADERYRKLKRFFVLSAKYAISIERDGINKDIIDALKNDFSKNIGKDESKDKCAALDKFLKTIYRVEGDVRVDYLKTLAETKLLRKSFPQVQKALDNPKFYDNPPQNYVEFLSKVEKVAPPHEKFATREELLILTAREPEKLPPDVRVYVSSLQKRHEFAKLNDNNLALVARKKGKEI